MATSEPAPPDPVIPAADPADVAEQQAEVGSRGAVDESRLSDDPEVPEADNLEQAQTVDDAPPEGS